MPVLTKINTNSIAEDAITGDKFSGDAYLSNTATQNITGTYSENRLYTSDAYTLSGNATVNSNLTLSSVKPTDDVVLTAGGAYTITGTGVLSGGSLYGRQTLTGMSGELGSTVTGSPNLNLGAISFPSGKVNNVFRFSDTTTGSVSVTGTTTAKVASATWKVSCTSGRHYVVIGFQYLYADRGSGTIDHRTMGLGLRYDTTDRTAGANTSGGTLLCATWLGRQLASTSSSGAPSYASFNYEGFFTAGSTATHYIWTTIGMESSGGVRGTAHAQTNNPHICTVWEIMP